MLFLPKLKIIYTAVLFIGLSTLVFAASLSQSHIDFSAKKIEQTVNEQENLLVDDVRITAGKKIKISCDKALVIYEGKKIVKFVIYGQGIFKSGPNKMQFKNAIFYPQDGRIEADELTRIN